MIRKTSFFAVCLLISLLAQSAIAQDGRKLSPPTNATVGPVTSSNQANGVTAGYINSFQQTIAPPLVRGPLLDEFKRRFTYGASILRNMKLFDDIEIPKSQVEQFCTSASQWQLDTFNWLEKTVGKYPAERFLFKAISITNSYKRNMTIGDRLSPQNYEGDCERSLEITTENLDTMMRDPSIYPLP